MPIAPILRSFNGRPGLWSWVVRSVNCCGATRALAEGIKVRLAVRTASPSAKAALSLANDLPASSCSRRVWTTAVLRAEKKGLLRALQPGLRPHRPAAAPFDRRPSPPKQATQFVEERAYHLGSRLPAGALSCRQDRNFSILPTNTLSRTASSARRAASKQVNPLTFLLGRPTSRGARPTNGPHKRSVR